MVEKYEVEKYLVKWVKRFCEEYRRSVKVEGKLDKYFEWKEETGKMLFNVSLVV